MYLFLRIEDDDKGDHVVPLLEDSDIRKGDNIGNNDDNENNDLEKGNLVFQNEVDKIENQQQKRTWRKSNKVGSLEKERGKEIELYYGRVFAGSFSLMLLIKVDVIFLSTPLLNEAWCCPKQK